MDKKHLLKNRVNLSKLHIYLGHSVNDNNLDNQINNPSSFESHYYGNIPLKNVVAVYTPF